MLRILGPLELTVDGRAIDLGGARQRIVLSMLAMQANRVASVDQLIDAVWADSPPTTARGQIQICISTLRKLFTAAGHPDAIETRPPGYLLRIDDLDKARFEELLAEGLAQVEGDRLSDAVETLHTALQLWRGPALADIDGEAARRGVRPLEDARFSAQLAYLRAKLILGGHHEVIGTIRALIAEHPLHEELHGLLMLALYRAGRQADALAAFRSIRAMLVEEIGIEPTLELQRLEHAILTQDPSLHPALAPPVPEPARLEILAAQPPEPVIVPQQLPASVGDFTGREREIADIVAALTDDAEVTPYAARVVAISGRGGIGKSSLAVRVGYELADAFPHGQLYAELKVPQGDEQTPEVLTRFLLALGVTGSALPEDPDDRLKLYRSAVADRRMLIVLDDVNDEQQVLPLLPGNPGCAVILTSRNRLSGLGGAHWIELDQFPEQNALDLLTRIIGPERIRDERAAATELVGLCGGLPLALRIAGARLASRPHWRISGLVRRLSDETSRLDEFVYNSLELRSTIELAYCGLSAAAKRLFRLSSLLQAPDFPAWTAAALLDCDLAEGEDVLETLIDVRLLDVVGHGSHDVRFRFHSLVRVYAVEQAATDSEQERRAALERVIGGWLTLGDEAHRIQYGGDYMIFHGNAPRWWPGDVTPTEIIEAAGDWWEAERRSLIAAVRHTAELGWAEACWDLAVSSVTLFESKGYFDDWMSTNQLARDAVRAAGNIDGQAALLYSVGEYHLYQRRLDEADRWFAEALPLFEASGNRHGVALTLCNSATVDRLREDFESMYPKYQRALETFRAVGDRIAEAYTLCSLAKYWIGEGEHVRTAKALNDALVICRAEQCRRVEAQVLLRLSEAYLATDQVGLAAQAADSVLLLVRELQDRTGEAHAEYTLGCVRLREGSLDSAEAALGRALALAVQVRDPLIVGLARHALAEICLLRDDLPAADTHLIEAAASFDALRSTIWQIRTKLLHAEVHAARPDPSSAASALDQAESLLSTLDSRAATHLRTRLHRTRATLPTPS
ncbi:BTAD domain-containing putative transcriptional regulator [Actinocorallia lasiicapitis]